MREILPMCTCMAEKEKEEVLRGLHVKLHGQILFRIDTHSPLSNVQIPYQSNKIGINFLLQTGQSGVQGTVSISSHMTTF